MGIDHLFGDTPPGGSPPPRLTPRSPLSIKELTAILVLGALVWGAYDRLNKFAEKTAVEQIATSQWQMRLDTQHNFDTLNNKVDDLIKSQAQQQPATPEKRTHK